MNARIVVIFVGILILFRAGAACAEPQTWAEITEKIIRAEVALDAAGAVLQNMEVETQGDPNKPGEEEPSLQDPPRLEIDVSFNNQSKTVGTFGSWRNSYQLIYEIIHPSVTITKSALDEYTASLTLEMAILGQSLETERYILLDRITQTFRYEDQDEIIFESAPIDLYHTRDSVQTGIEYYGYVVLVRDSLGQTLVLKSNYSKLERNAVEILSAELPAEFDRKLKPVKPRKPGGDVIQYIFR